MKTDDIRYEIRTQRENGNPDYSILPIIGTENLAQFLREYPGPAMGYYRTIWTDERLLDSAEWPK